MDPLFLILLSSFLPPSLHALTLQAPRITVIGAVFCDVCYNNTFSPHSFLLPGVDVNVECKFKENSISVSVNTSTDRFGVYRFEIENGDGVGGCIRGRSSSEALCRATLLKSSHHHSFCNIRGVKATSTDIMSFKSRQNNNKNHECIYSLSALSYRPFKRNTSLCAYNTKILSDPRQYNSSNVFLIPPYGFFWPPYLPQLPPLPQLPNLPFPFPPTPPLFSSPPVFSLGDPRAWFPNLPSPPLVPPPPPPSSSFDLGNPRTWIPFNPPTPPPPS